MKKDEWTWTSNDNIEITAKSWVPDSKPKAVICLVHGLGEHSGRYAHVGKTFTESGFALAGFDLRGHGKSGGQRGHYPSLKTLMGDLHQQCEQINNRFPKTPQFMYGHSLGGLFVLVYATYQHHSLTGIISVAPALQSPVLEQKNKMAMVNFLGGLFPTLTIPTGLDPESISRNTRIVRDYQEDPLVHDQATLSTGKIGLQAIEWVLAHTESFPSPLLILHGTEDKLVYPSGSKELSSMIEGNLTTKFFDGLYHELHNEPEKDQVLAFSLDWMNSQLKNK